MPLCKRLQGSPPGAQEGLTPRNSALLKVDGGVTKKLKSPQVFLPNEDWDRVPGSSQGGR